MSVQYLLRFDDCCPTMNWSMWREVEKILFEFEIKPLLAVVPDNQDETLRVSGAHVNFWDEVRAWQARGWMIGLHGYQHLYVTRDEGLIGIRKLSEFSGLSYLEQRTKLQRAIDVFARERVTPEVWVAPGHSFDRNTLQALSDLGVRHVSDGFSFYPFIDSCKMLWIPQQLWRFRKMPFGLWTVCIHLNRWTAREVARFHSEVREFTPALTDWQSAISTYQNRKRSSIDSLFSRAYRSALRGRRWLRHTNS